MGGRGSAYERLVNQLLKSQEEQQLKQREEYNGRPVTIEDFLWDEESEIHDEMFNRLKGVNISTRESTDKVNKYALTINQKEVEFIAKEFDYILNEADFEIQLGAEKLSSKTNGQTLPFIDNGKLRLRVVFSEDNLNNLAAYREKQIADVKSNWHAPIDIQTNASKYTAIHEMGHVVEWCIFKKIIRNNPTISRSQKDLAIKVRNDVEKILKNKYTKPGEDAIMNISDYSTMNSMEWFAETFCNLILTDKEPIPVAKALDDYIRSFE